MMGEQLPQSSVQLRGFPDLQMEVFVSKWVNVGAEFVSHHRNVGNKKILTQFNTLKTNRKSFI